MSDSVKKILIAEDNPGLARVLSFKFKSCGFTPVACADGLLAWETFQNDPEILAVVSDQEMPRMTGVELCQNIRQSNQNIPFFLVTGRQLELSTTGVVDQLNISEIFAKPFSPANVVAAVETAISKASEATVS